MDPATTQAVAKATEETAKTAGKALQIVHDVGGYLRSVFAELPADLVGVAGGAWVHEVHIRIKDAWRRRTEEILRERDVQDVIELSPNMAAALIEGAQEEGREELMELWARLLANAMDPNLNSVRQSFIEAVKKMDPPDAVVLKFLAEQNLLVIRYRSGPLENNSTHIGAVSDNLHCRIDEVHVSLEHLKGIGFFDGVPTLLGGGHQDYHQDYHITVKS